MGMDKRFRALYLTMLGMTEASTTRRFSTPYTRVLGSTTAISSTPILAVQQGWYALSVCCRIHALISSSVRTSGPGLMGFPVTSGHEADTEPSA